MRYERLDKIMSILEEAKNITLDALCEKLEVSKNTIRRDIAQLEKDGKIKKFYGGIRLVTNNDPTPFSERQTSFLNEKKHIAKLAVDLIVPGDVIFIDSGTSTMHMVPYLSAIGNVTIVTSSLNIMVAAAQNNLSLIGTGGTFYGPANSFVGSAVLQALSQYNFSHAFMSSSGISLSGGATNASPLESETKKFIMKTNCRKTLLIDNSKFGKNALITFAALSEFDNIITDRKPPEEYEKAIKAQGVRIIY